MARPKHSLLTRDRIIEVASKLVDAEGLEAVSVRRLATELGVAGPSLYNHFATKGEILDAVADTVVAQVDVTFFDTCEWDEALRSWAHSYRAVLAEHPNIVPVLSHGPGRRPAALAMADTVYGGLIAAGWPPARATHIGALMRYLVTGAAWARSPSASTRTPSCTPSATPTSATRTCSPSTVAAWTRGPSRSDWKP